MLPAVGTSAPPAGWSEGADHDEVIETLLAMAESEHRWGDSPRALALLDHVERIVGTLPDAYQRLRADCRCDASRLAVA
jgi:hypothetical protein